MKPRLLPLLQRVVWSCSNMWRYPNVDNNNLSWLSNLQQQQQLQGATRLSQDSRQCQLQQTFQYQPYTNTTQSVNEDSLVNLYPFVYTNGEQSVRFYEQFYRNCTGKRTPDMATTSRQIAGSDLVTVSGQTSKEVVTEGEVINQKEGSLEEKPSNSDTINRGSKRTRSYSGGQSEGNGKKGMQRVSSDKTSGKCADGDIIMCDLDSPQCSVIDLTGWPETSHLTAKVPTEKRHQRPIQRKFLVTKYGREQRKSKAHSRQSSVKFSVATYNVLSQNLLEDNSYLYTNCVEDCLTWERRSKLILDQISQNHPDVLCLQEIEEGHFQRCFHSELTKKGYKGVYKKRTGSKPDGCAIFYNSRLFTLEASSKVEYLKKGVSNLDRDNVGLIALLSLKTSAKTKVCVANTHLLFNPKRGDVKLAQLQVLFTEIDKLASRKEIVKPWKSVYHPVIFCGDLNFEPFSDLYKFVISGSLTYQGLLCRNMSGQDEGRGGGNRMMSKYILPEELGISDQCQYEEIFKERYTQYNDAHTKKQKKEDRVKSSEKQEVIVIEDGEIIDDEEAGPSRTTSSVVGDKNQDVDDVEEKECVIVNTSSSSDSRNKSDSASTVCDDHDMEQGECVILNISSSSDIKNRSDSTSAVGDDDLDTEEGEYVAGEDTPKSPHSYSELREMTNKSKKQLAAYAIKMQSGKELEASVSKHCSHNKGSLSHQMNLVSVYSHEFRNKDKKWSTEVTTNHGRTNCTVDYIFYSVDDKEVHFSSYGAITTTKVKEGKLKLLEKLELFVDDELYDIGGLPNEHEGSDHIMLLAKFQLKLK